MTSEWKKKNGSKWMHNYPQNTDKPLSENRQVFWCDQNSKAVSMISIIPDHYCLRYRTS